MQIDAICTPDYIFESSWEVCNKVGGIYTVLSSRANSLQKHYPEKIIFIGPDIWKNKQNPWFEEDTSLFSKWRKQVSEKMQVSVRTGRWNVPGKPIVLLVDFEKYTAHKNEIYGTMWETFGVDSLQAYGDYDEACMFAYATGKIIENFYRFHRLETANVVAHFNEWMMGFGALYIKKNAPKIATIFTTHATSIGRSIAGNGLPLYNQLSSYNGDQMARELNMVSKHSVEKKAAQHVDCFTTVSEITAKECAQFLERHPDVITVNGFEKDFIPKGNSLTKHRRLARERLMLVTEKLLGQPIQKDALLIGTSGRYEYKNKGIDLFVDALNRLRKMPQLSKDIIAFVMVPAWTKAPREDLRQRLYNPISQNDKALNFPFITHTLHQPESDFVLNQINYLKFSNCVRDRVKIIFIPSYLNGNDGIFDMTYYELLIGLDATVFPSYYEPWGYTPHESIAFSVPTITTTLAGFGLWCKKKRIDNGVKVISRDDTNSLEVSGEIANILYELSLRSEEQIKLLRKAARERAKEADWTHFITHYQEAYRKALHNSFLRLSKQSFV